MLALLGSMNLSAQKREWIAEHEFRLGVGVLPMLFRNIGLRDMVGGADYILRYGPLDTHFNDLLQYDGPNYTMGSLSVGYTYNIKRWLSVGATFSYVCEYQRKHDRFSNRVVGRQEWNDMFFTPMVRFTFLNRKYVRLYSQLGLGVRLTEYKVVAKGQKTYREHKWDFSGQITLLGVSVGNKLFGFAEFPGFGAQGALVAGIGYRF